MNTKFIYLAAIMVFVLLITTVSETTGKPTKNCEGNCADCTSMSLYECLEVQEISASDENLSEEAKKEKEEAQSRQTLECNAQYKKCLDNCCANED